MNPVRTQPRRFPLVLLFPGLVAAVGVIWAAGSIDQRSVTIALCTAAAIMALGYGRLRRLRSSVEHIQQGLNRFAEGRLDARVEHPPLRELAIVCDALNAMARQLERRLRLVNQQSREHEAILTSMAEGVIALDRDAVILQVNRAAAQLLGGAPEMITGRSMYEMIRNHELQKIVEQSLEAGSPGEGEVTLHGTSERSLQVHSRALRNADAENIGALVVINDITRLRRLERMRRDFVANVSHELKTPLTAIRGFVETLLDGALEEPEEAHRYCVIIARQVDRLQNIIEDLLSLSRLEQDVEAGQIALTESALLDVMQAAAQSVAHAAAEKNARIEITCDPSIKAHINAPLLEQVMVNLLDNAIKYSEINKTIQIRVQSAPGVREILVIDQGLGIEAAHLDRIFERFYRVDKARSSKEGGTGLGLSIVKRIVAAHGGQVRVESTPGTGSTFIVSLPQHPLTADQLLVARKHVSNGTTQACSGA